MKKILFLFIAIVFLYQPIEITAQDYLKSATATGSGTTTNNSKVWTDLTSVSIDLGSNTTDTKYVLVTASFNMRPDGSSTQGREVNYNIYRYDDDTDKSGVIKRQIIRNSETGVESWGIGTLVHIFDVSSLTGSKTYTLEHSNQGVSNDGRNVYSFARLTAVALTTATNHYELSNDVKRLEVDVTTTSSTYAAVTGTTTDAIILPIKGDIFVVASINGKAGGAGSVAEYKLEYSTDGGGTWVDLGKSVKRSMINSYDDGIVSLVCMLQDQNADNDFKFRVSHKRVSGTNTITTHNCNLVAVALVHSGDGYFPSFCSEVDATGVDVDWGDPYELVTSSTFTAAADISGTGTSLFVSSQYLIEASNLQTTPNPDERMRAGNQLYADDGTTILYADEYCRYTPDNSSFGAGGFIGLMTDLEDEGSYTIGMNHKVVYVSNHTSPYDEILTTSQVILTGFQTYDQNGLSGSYDIGVGGDYTSLSCDGGLFADINAAGLCGNVTANIISDITETGANQLNQWTEYDGTDYTLTIQPDGTTLRTLSSTGGTPVYFNGADRVTINGGAGKHLTFKCAYIPDPQYTEAVFFFEAGATSNTITNCNIESNVQSFSPKPNNAAIEIVAYGGDNEVTISNCNIYNSGASAPLGCGIYINSYNSQGYKNTVTISNNNIYNFAATTAANVACGIYVNDEDADVGNPTQTTTSITGNSFYCNLATAPTSNQTAILIDGGISHTVTGNYIGGQSASCGGSAWSNTGYNYLKGIEIRFGPTGTTYDVSGNIMQNINTTANCWGYYNYKASVDFNSNTIGHASTANSIITSASAFIGAYLDDNNNSSYVNTIEDNIIANIQTNSSGYTLNNGIYISAESDIDILKNKIYNIGPPNNSTPGSDINGIYFAVSDGTSTYTLVNNVVSLGAGLETNSWWVSVWVDIPTGATANLYYNSLFLDGSTSDGANVWTCCVYRANSNTFVSKNNIIYNSRSDAAYDDEVYDFGSTGSVTSNNNILYAPDGVVAYYNSTTYTTLANWQGAISQDASSYSVDPHYTSVTNLQPQTGYYKPGVTISGITTDIDGTTRSNPPSIGAYEGINYHNVWAGTVSTAWNTADNWDVASVPAASDNVTIADVANDPVISNSGIAQVHDLTINSGATLTLQPGAQMTINGDLTTNDGLTIQNSVASPTSLINKGTVTGDVSVEWTYPDSRYMYVGHSVDGVKYTDYSAVITDPVNNLWLYRWPGSWNRITSNTDLDGTEDELEGYAVKLKEGSDVTVEYSGSLRYGTYSSTFNGYKLIANPYAAYIDLEGLGTDIGTVIDSTVWTSANGSGELVFATYNILTDVGANGGTRYIAPGQSFWIEHSVSSDLTVRPGLRTYGDGGVLKGTSVTPDDILRLVFINDTEIQSDEVVLLFRPVGTVDEVTMYDSKKRIGTAKIVPNVYALKGADKVVIAAYPEAGLIDTVRIGYKFAQEKEITLKATNINEFRAIDNVYLFDKKTGVEVNLRETPEYTFMSTAGEDANRFEIYFTHLTTGINDIGNEGITGDKIQIYGIGQKGIVKVTEDILAEAEGKGIIRLYSAAGSRIKEINLTDVKTTIDLPVNYGVYIIEVSTGERVVTGKVTRIK